MKVINQIKISIFDSEEKLLEKVAKVLHVKVSSIDKSKLKILHKSIDARDKSDIKFVYNVAVDYEARPYDFCSARPAGDIKQPIIVGFGPAGIFAAYLFAINGVKPIILERGKSLDDRIKDCDKFFKSMELNPESNVCFGEGGAGAFSDGKLNTNNKDKTGVYRFVLETFVKFGADPKITYENLPHIGTDKLVDVIKNMRNEIINLGAEIRFNTKFTVDEFKKYAEDGHPIILAIGNSSRDTFRDLYEHGFDLKAKAFAIGYRIAHRQEMINKNQYGDNNVARILGPATYKLTYDVGNGHSVYSFCMCPGGYIINSSNSKGMLSINGMSYNDRSGMYANSAIVETITPEDLLACKGNVAHRATTTKGLVVHRAMQEINPLIGVEFQEKVERIAFALENGYIPYKRIYGSDICHDDVFKGQAKETEKLMAVYENLNLPFDINEDIKKALAHFNKIIPGFYGENAKNDDKSDIIIAGVETRTSSPVKLDRDENMMCNVENFYPCGEGLGHGGGILSSAADGINVAYSILKRPQYIV